MVGFVGELCKAEGGPDFGAPSTAGGLAIGAGFERDLFVATGLGVASGTTRLFGASVLSVFVSLAGLGAADDLAAGVPFINGLVAETGAGAAEAGGGTAKLISSMSSSRPRVSGLKRYPIPVKGSADAHIHHCDSVPLRMEAVLPSP